MPLVAFLGNLLPFEDEIYQISDFDYCGSHVLLRLDQSSVDLSKPGAHQRSMVGLSPGHDLTARGEYSVLRLGTRPQSGLRRATTFADRRQKERQEQLVCVYRSPTNSRAPKLYAYLVELGAEGEETTTLWHVFACPCLQVAKTSGASCLMERGCQHRFDETNLRSRPAALRTRRQGRLTLRIRAPRTRET